MSDFKRIWAIPIIVGLLILFGLLTALLGIGVWHWMSWLAFVIIIGIVFVVFGKSKFRDHSLITID